MSHNICTFFDIICTFFDILLIIAANVIKSNDYSDFITRFVRPADVWNDDWSEATFSPYWEGVRGMGRQGALPGARKSRKASDNQRLFCFSVLPQGLEPWTPTLRVSCSTN